MLIPFATANLKPASTGTNNFVEDSAVVEVSPVFVVVSKLNAPTPTAKYGLMMLLKNLHLVLAIVNSPDTAADQGIFVSNSEFAAPAVSFTPLTLPPMYLALISKEGVIWFFT